jgi:hypothetical protein
VRIDINLYGILRNPDRTPRKSGLEKNTEPYYAIASKKSLTNLQQIDIRILING